MLFTCHLSERDFIVTPNDNYRLKIEFTTWCLLLLLLLLLLLFDSCVSQCPSPPLTMWMFPSGGGYFLIVTFIASVSQCVRVCMYVFPC